MITRKTRPMSPRDRRALARIAPPLLEWFRAHQRDLPWRGTRDPYAIWLSEVMLQQTRVATVIPYYERFLARFPDARALAAASEDDVLREWAGLGYYSRGRNLQRAAAQMVREHAGRMPEEYAAIRALPGVGEYTARAVGSIAFGHPHAVVDGNVERVLCRYLALAGDPRRPPLAVRIASCADAALDRRTPGDHNQAMMELGATVCLPKNPDCAVCPLEPECRVRALGRQHAFPTPRARRPSEAGHWLALVVRTGSDCLLVRADVDAPLLRGQWGLPLAELGATPPAPARLLARARDLARRSIGNRVTALTAHPTVRHSITYRRMTVHPVSARLGERPPPPCPEVRRAPLARADELPALYRKVLLALD